MEEIFLCHKCGAQNAVGQQACQACGEKFQYKCPGCGSIVDATMINCPNCRGGLDWPTPLRVKAFPRKQADAQPAHERFQAGAPGARTGKKKRDPLLIGCLALIVIVILIGAVLFVIDTLL